MRIRPAHLLLCGALFVTPLTACGGSSKKDTTTTTSASTTTTKAASGSSAGSGNTDLVKYCNDVAAFVKKGAPILKSKDQTAALALRSDAEALASEAAKLSTTVVTESAAQLQADQPKLEACEKQFQDLATQFNAAFG